jgi:hypothetical protein
VLNDGKRKAGDALLLQLGFNVVIYFVRPRCNSCGEQENKPEKRGTLDVSFHCS